MKKTYFYAGLAIFFWSTTAAVVKPLLGTLDTIQTLFISSLFTTLFLLIVNVATGNIKKLKCYKVRDYVTTVLIGIPGTLLYYLFYYAGTSRMPASQAFIVNYLWPIMSVVFACILLKEKMTLRKGIAIVLSFVGVIVMTGSNQAGFGGEMLTGALCCFLGAVSYGLFTALNQKKFYDKRLSVMIFYFSTFLITGVVLLSTGDGITLNGSQVMGLTWNGIFCMGVANTCWMLALESGNTARISNLTYITPFLSLVWTAIFLKEQVTVYSVLGLAVIVFGILIQLKDKKA